MSNKIQIGDSIWCDKKGFGFIVERIEQQYNQSRQIYYGTIAGQEIYIASEVARKIPLAPQELTPQILHKIIEAMESVCEELDFALQKLGVCGQGDGRAHTADAESFGGTATLESARNIIDKIKRG